MYRRILVPVDGSPTSERGLQEAVGLARTTGATLHLLHLLTEHPMYADMAPPGALKNTLDNIQGRGERLLAKAGATAKAQGVEADTRLRPAGSRTVAELIVDEAVDAGCDLIVMGTHGRRGLSRITMGSDAEGVIRRAPVPLLLIREPG